MANNAGARHVLLVAVVAMMVIVAAVHVTPAEGFTISFSGRRGLSDSKSVEAASVATETKSGAVIEGVDTLDQAWYPETYKTVQSYTPYVPAGTPGESEGVRVQREMIEETPIDSSSVIPDPLADSSKQFKLFMASKNAEYKKVAPGIDDCMDTPGCGTD